MLAGPAVASPLGEARAELKAGRPDRAAERYADALADPNDGTVRAAARALLVAGDAGIPLVVAGVSATGMLDRSRYEWTPGDLGADTEGAEAAVRRRPMRAREILRE